MTLLEVVNQALVAVGQPPVAEWNEKPNLYKQLKSILPIALDSFTAMGDWTFAKERQSLSLTETSTHDYQWTGDLPEDCLRVLGTKPSVKYEIEGNSIYLDVEDVSAEGDPPAAAPVTLIYMKRIFEWTGDPEVPAFITGLRITPAIAEAMAMAVAVRVAVAFTADVQITNMLNERMGAAIQQANAMSMEENPGYNPKAGSTSLLEVVNEALTLAGHGAVNNWLVTSQTMETVKAILPRALGSLSSEVYWSFAKYRHEYAEGDEVASNWPTYEYRYELPEDILRVVRLEPEVQFEIEGRWLYTNTETPTLVYTRRVYEMSDEGNLAFIDDLRIPPKFREALSYKIAQDIATRLNGDPNMSMLFRQQYQETVRSAIEENEMETPGLMPTTEVWSAQSDVRWDEV